MFPFFFIAVGFGVGFVLGRWWVLLVALALGLWAGTTQDVGVPGWLIGAYIGLPTGIGIATGVVTRRMLASRRAARA